MSETPPVETTSTDYKARRKKRRRRSRVLKRISRFCGYCGLRFAEATIARLPFRAGMWLSRFAGALGYYFAHTSRRIAIENLTRVYGEELSPKEIRIMVRRVFQNTVGTAIEYFILRRWSTEQLEAAFPECAKGIRQLETDVKATGGGVVGLTAHHGNWEVLSLFVARFAPGLLVPIAKPAYYQRYQDFIDRLRREDGAEVIYNTESPRRIIRAVKKGQLLGILPDQDLRTNSGVFVDFFGKLAWTVTFPVGMARRLNVPMTYCVLVRDDATLQRRGYHFVYKGFFHPPRTEDEQSDLQEGTAQWTRILESIVREDPDQWSWIYQRWKSTPDRPRRPKAERPAAASEAASAPVEASSGGRAE